jgi:hypothetical protein
VHDSITARWSSIAILQVLGDAEVFLFDWVALTEAQRAALLATHLRAFDRNARRKRGPEWAAELVPFGLLGTSMPEVVRERVELSAPHEGCLLFDRRRDRVLYVSGADDLRAFVAYEAASQMRLAGSAHREPFSIGEIDFAGPPTEHTGFTLAELRTAFGPLLLSIGRFGFPLAVFERLWSLRTAA